MADIYKKLNQVMQTVKAVGKDSKNQQQGYKFRGIDAVMNALHPAFSKAGVFVVPQVLEHTREERTNNKGTLLISSICKVKYTFYAADGSSVEAIVIGEGMDSGDKSMNKAMSAAYKYACFQVLCIPTEEMKDSEKDSPEPVSRDRQELMKPITDKEREILRRMCVAKGYSPEKVFPKGMDFTVEQYLNYIKQINNAPDQTKPKTEARTLPPVNAEKDRTLPPVKPEEATA